MPEHSKSSFMVKIVNGSLPFMLFLLMWLLLMGPSGARTVLGEEPRSFSAGVGLGLSQVPEESGYKAVGVPVNIYFDWRFYFIDNIDIRFGYTTARAELRFEAYNSDWRYLLRTDSLFIAYRVSWHYSEKSDVFLFVGPVYVRSELQTNKAGSTSRDDAVFFKDQGFGYIGGIGGYRTRGYFDFGFQVEYLSRQARFDDTENATGHSLIQLTGRYRF